MEKIDKLAAKIADDILTIQKFKIVFERVSKLNADIDISIPEEKTWLVVKIIERYIDDEEIEQHFKNINIQQKKILRKMELGLKKIDPNDVSKNRELYEEAEQELDDFVLREMPKLEYEILKLTYEKLKNNPAILHDYDGMNGLINVTQTAGLSDLLYALPKITKNGKLEDLFVSKQQVYQEEKSPDMTLNYIMNIVEEMKKDPVLTENHQKLFVYALCKHAYTGNTRVLIDYDNFFAWKGIEPSKDNKKKLRQEIKELENVEFDYRYKEKGTWKKVSKARILMYTDTKRGKGITVTMGSWVDYLPTTKTFTQIDKAFFGLPVNGKKIGSATLLLKLRQLHSMGKKAISVRNLVELKNISESLYINHGFLRIKDDLENDLEILREQTAFKWRYRNGIHDSRVEFEQDYVEFWFEDKQNALPS